MGDYITYELFVDVALSLFKIQVLTHHGKKMQMKKMFWLLNEAKMNVCRISFPAELLVDWRSTLQLLMSLFELDAVVYIVLIVFCSIFFSYHLGTMW